MKTRIAIVLGIVFSSIFLSCKESGTESDVQTGKLVFQAVKSMPAQTASLNKNYTVRTAKNLNSYIMHTLDLKLNIAEIWVSQDQFAAGGTDNLRWHKIGENSQMKSFSDYSFTAENLPVGVYKSIKIVMKRLGYRVATYQNDRASIVEMLEINGPWQADYCSDFNALAPSNYFNTSGNFNLENGRFICINSGETLTGFEIKPGKITRLYWKMGDERNFDPYSFTFEWFDENNNGVWDCGIDSQDNYTCNLVPPVETMWIFIARYD